MKQRDIFYASLDPVKGSEQSGYRPVVITSGNSMNDNMNICIVCPLTTKLKYIKTRVLVKKDNNNNLKQDSEILAVQIRTVSKSRFKDKIGEITEQQLDELQEKINDILKY